MIDIEQLLSKSALKVAQVPRKFERYLYNQISDTQRLIGIKGARGVGKTTLLLQLAHRLKDKNVLYVSLDDLFFTSNNLYSLAEEFVQLDGSVLLLDEVHKYPNWSREIKLIYDDFPSLRVIFTSSSILDIYKGESDLSRRAITYELKPLSLREFLVFFKGVSMDSFALEDILDNHQQIALSILDKIKPLVYYKEYLKVGAYPFYLGDETEYYQQLQRTIHLILEVDLPSIKSIDYLSITKIKRLLHVLALSVPFTPNISRLAQKVELPRNALVEVLYWLSKAHLIHSYYKESKSVSALGKPDKIWLYHSNIHYALSNYQSVYGRPDVGNLRETFFLSQLAGNYAISIPPTGDFFINQQCTFEIGGKDKKNKQIKDLKEAYIVKDNIEVGAMNQIPLWLFGFLY